MSAPQLSMDMNSQISGLSQFNSTALCTQVRPEPAHFPVVNGSEQRPGFSSLRYAKGAVQSPYKAQIYAAVST